MTTKTNKPVTRETYERVVDRGSKRRELHVTIADGDVLILRMKGTRQSRTIAISSVWYYAQRLYAEQLRREKAALKKAKKEGRA